MNKIKLLFIINPKSGISKKRDLPELITKNIDGNLFDVSIKFSNKAGNVTELAEVAVAENFNAVVAVGGDGSVNEVAKVLINTDVHLGIIPCGSGNGIARALNIPLNIIEAINIINRFETKRIDTASINNEPYLGIAGVGFEAHIASLFMLSKKRGFMNYIKLVFLEFWKFQSNYLVLHVDGKEIYSGCIFTAAASNTNQYGNGAFIAPSAKADDGVLNFTIIKKVSFLNAPNTIYRLFNKSLNNSKNTISAVGKAAVFKTDSIYFHKDGEAQTTDGEIKVRINPLSLSVII